MRTIKKRRRGKKWHSNIEENKQEYQEKIKKLGLSDIRDPYDGGRISYCASDLDIYPTPLKREWEGIKIFFDILYKKIIINFNKQETAFVDIVFDYYTAKYMGIEEILLNNTKIDNNFDAIEQIEKIKDKNELVIKFKKSLRVYRLSQLMIYPISDKRDNCYYMRIEAQRLMDLAKNNHEWREEEKQLIEYEWEEEKEEGSWKSIYKKEGLRGKDLLEAVEKRMEWWKRDYSSKIK